MSDVPSDEEQQSDDLVTNDSVDVSLEAGPVATSGTKLLDNIFPVRQPAAAVSIKSPLPNHNNANGGGNRTTADQDDPNPNQRRYDPHFNDPLVRFVDHFSLGAPSSVIRFRNTNTRSHTCVHLYGERDDQFMVEDRIILPPEKEQQQQTQEASNPKKNDDEAPKEQPLDNDTSQEQQQQQNGQEQLPKHIITVRRAYQGSAGLVLLRTIYTLVAFCVFGLLFCLCFQVILFLFLNLPSYNIVKDLPGTRDNHIESPNLTLNQVALVGDIMSIPITLYAMATLMKMGGTFVIDVWNGHTLLRTMWNSSKTSNLRVPVVITEWVCLGVFLAVPAIATTVSMLLGIDNWWEVTSLAWITAVFVFLLVFIVTVCACEVSACLQLVRLLHYDDEEERKEIRRSHYRYKRPFSKVFWRWWRLAERAVLLTETNFYSGHVHEQYRTTRQGMEDPPYYSGANSLLLNSGGSQSIAERYRQRRSRTPVLTFTSLWTRFTQCRCLRATRTFEHLWPPVRIFSLDEVREEVPFLMAQNWSLESMFCRNPRAHTYWLMARRPHSEKEVKEEDRAENDNAKRTFIQPNQIRASLTCVLAGLFMMVLLFASLMIWLSLNVMLVIGIVVVAFVCFFFPLVYTSIQVYRWYYNDADSADPASAQKGAVRDSIVRRPSLSPTKDDYAVVQVWETVRVTQPAPSLCWVMYMLEMAAFFLFPGVTFFAAGNIRHGLAFTALAIFAWFRAYFSPDSVLMQVGSFHGSGVVLLDTDSQDDRALQRQRAQLLRETARLSRIISNISRGRQVGGWVRIFGTLVVGVAVTFLIGFLTLGVAYNETAIPMTSIGSFYYAPDPDLLSYPMCELTKGLFLPLPRIQPQSASSVALLDIAFMASTAYNGEAQSMLDLWFGPGEVIDQAEFVKQYRRDTNAVAGVSFNLFSLKNNPEFSVLSIRGSENMWDWLVDIQLWSAAGLAQLVRTILPVGEIWTPILDNLVSAVNFIESESLQQVAYYQTTSKFVEDLKSGYAGNGQFTKVRVTGASLGGGIAIITGCQTNTSAVAISGPNAMMSRHSFVPPITMEALNTRVLNVIPDRDVVANLDDPGRLIQRINCRAPENDGLECHSMWRTVCELAFTCGSQGRPIPCWCHSRYGYDKPIQNGTVTWEEACPT